MDEATIYSNMDEAVQKVTDHVAHEFSGVNTGKANPSMVENVSVEAYGSRMPLKEVAAISTPDARTIAVQPWDKSVLKSVEKALQTANLGMNPAVVGDIIRLPLPELTRERREEFVKVVNRFAEEGRVGARRCRHDAMDALKKLEKDSSLSEDDVKRAEKEIQGKTDAAIKEINDLLAAKEKDLRTV